MNTSVPLMASKLIVQNLCIIAQNKTTTTTIKKRIVIKIDYKIRQRAAMAKSLKNVILLLLLEPFVPRLASRESMEMFICFGV